MVATTAMAMLAKAAEAVVVVVVLLRANTLVPPMVLRLKALRSNGPFQV